MDIIIDKYKDLDPLSTIIFWGIIGAIIGSNIAKHMNTQILKKFFGIFLAFIAIHEIYTIFRMYKNNKKNNTI